ncbi:11139_t:CDS:2 [Entrophospora sp. SA101]|nr:11139_t:CDS:2 [Entrophospora sp. SA101]CAJ0865813.1 7036_t:CDS:2 [Entrophospora sp. SA101]
MKGTSQKLKELVERLNSNDLKTDVEVVIAPPAIYIEQVRNNIRKDNIKVAAQNAYKAAEGAFTGEISPEQLKDIGIEWVILGHSERREIFKESDDFIADKIAHALKAGVKVIACVGEKERLQDDPSLTFKVIDKQLRAIANKVNDWTNVVIAYEPVWAIGTGLFPTPEKVLSYMCGLHGYIRNWLKENVSESASENTRVIYGGSVDAHNSLELAKQPDIDGFLVGGASLKPEFVDIINSKI